MTTNLIYLTPVCPTGCAYCFQDPDCLSLNNYDLDKVLDTVKKIYSNKQSMYDPLVLHGGEICALPIKDIEYILKECTKITPQNLRLQTSTYKMTLDHIKLFKQYNVNVGISVDGPPDLNILRGPRDEKLNKEYQDNLIKCMQQMRDHNMDFGAIAVIHKANASKDKVDILLKWIVENKLNIRLNPMFLPFWAQDTDLKEMELTPEEVSYVWKKAADCCLEHPDIGISPIREFIDNLLGLALSPCNVSRCDYVTTFVRSILCDGNISRCDRCFQEGYYYRGENQNFDRNEILKQTECKDCKYFAVCAGGCPGETVDFDFRHKTRFCQAHYELYEYLEKKIRGLFPNIILSIDVPNVYENFFSLNYPLPWYKNMLRSAWGKNSQIVTPEEISDHENGFGRQLKNVSEDKKCGCGK